MKILALADMIDREMIETAVEQIIPDYTLQVYDWKLASTMNELQKLIIKIEKNGPGVVGYRGDIKGKIREFNPDIIITHFAPITKEMIEISDNLKIIGIMRGGTENVDLAAASDSNVDVINTPGRNANAVAEFTVGLVLSEIKNIARGHASLKKGQWRRQYSNGEYSFELENKVVGVIGFGKVGQLVACKLLDGFGCSVLGYDPFVSRQDMEKYGVAKHSLNELLTESDIVTTHARLSEDTVDLIAEDEIKLMKKSAILVNTARAGLINREALYQALLQKEIAGAALDVFWDEPIDINNSFLNLDNVTLTPHYAGSTIEALSKSPLLLSKEIRAYFEKDDHSTVVN